MYVRQERKFAPPCARSAPFRANFPFSFLALFDVVFYRGHVTCPFFVRSSPHQGERLYLLRKSPPSSMTLDTARRLCHFRYGEATRELDRPLQSCFFLAQNSTVCTNFFSSFDSVFLLAQQSENSIIFTKRLLTGGSSVQTRHGEP